MVIPLNGVATARLILLIPDSRFQRLTDATIVPLMRSKKEAVRKIASLKFLRAFPRRRVRQFLEQYMATEQFYYNVIHWLDFGLSVPGNRVVRAAEKALADT